MLLVVLCATTREAALLLRCLVLTHAVLRCWSVLLFVLSHPAAALPR
jgi:hypothetical protein